MSYRERTTDNRHLSQVEFYQACEGLKKHRQKFLDERPTNKKAAEILGLLLGMRIAETSMATIREASGVKWEARRESRMNEKACRSHAVRTLTTSLWRLYKKLGEEIPSALSDLYEDNNRQQALEVGAQSNTEPKPEVPTYKH